ncbi:glycosyltransferase [Stieleria varia]|uniref:Alpha-D-kanosaminyltransferase n=1 Tax=Stieleria varia TaxID=2528005 RepID=A0A5C6B337_9BACT|nr:glycosyltransferase [Stieleria varia]TWU05922.1 Alpha-D-kanosaminyltransferase [Stieleria varia]
MKIDFVITELFAGGAERCLAELASGMHEQGDQVRVFSIGSLPTGKKAGLVDKILESGIEITSADANNVLAFWKARRRLIDWLSVSTPDVCQSFLFHANCLTAMALRAIGKTKNAGLPDDTESVVPLSPMPCFVGGLRVAERNRMRCFLERRAVSRMDSLVCVSGAVARFAQSHLGCSLERTRVIPNGVDVPRFSVATPASWPSVMSWDADSDVVLFVGRFHPQKGIELLQSQIDTIAPIGSRRKLLLIGDGPLRSGLQRWADLVGPERCQLLPWQSDIGAFLRAARLLVLPSHYEGMPNVILEAMAAGRPVVCSLVEGSDELLSHAKEHQSFPAGDSNEMMRRIDALLDNPELAERLGEANQARVRADFSIPSMIESYRSHYKSLMPRCQPLQGSL